MTPAARVIRKDVIVVGLGAFGSAALWRLAARAVDVCGIEQYGIGHNQGSSHGATRVFRVACHEHPDLTPVAQSSLRLWTELGEETGETLVSLGGALSTGRPDAPQVGGVLAAAEKHGLAVERLDAAEVAARFPAYGNLGRGDIGVFDPLGGICYPGVEPQPEKSIVCMITRSPDTQFVLGRPGDDPRLVVAGGDSGHGFKHAAGIGEILVRMAAGEEQESDLSFVSPSRFVTAG